jgi:hypothetical protein
MIMEKEECTNEWCNDGVTSISYGEKIFCGICEGTGFIDTETDKDGVCAKIIKTFSKEEEEKFLGGNII